MVYIDFHTHTRMPQQQVVAVKNIDLFAEEAINPQLLYTAGIHPWETKRTGLEQYLEQIKNLLQKSNVIGLGEVGLDKLQGAPLPFQVQLLQQQVKLAQSAQKPIIIHCVKAWDELLAIRKQFPQQPYWAIHGFNGSSQLASQLINTGFYLSVGGSLLFNKGKIRESLKTIPLDRLFFETDDSEIGIQEIYYEVAKLLNKDEKEVVEELIENFNHFFKREVANQ